MSGVPAFFTWVLAASLPFWLAGFVLKGFLPEGVTLNLPFAALMFVVPGVVGLAFLRRELGRDGASSGARGVAPRSAAATGRQSGGRGRAALSLVAAFLIMPVVFLAEYLILRARGVDMEGAAPSPLALGGLGLAFVASGLAEELGWSGYAYPRLRRVLGPMASGLVLGAFGALWHLVPYIQAARSASWILAQSAFTVAQRLLIVRFLEAKPGGAGFGAAVAIHASYNICWAAFPVYGSRYDPGLSFLLSLAALGLLAAWDRVREHGAEPPIEGSA